MLQYAEGQGHEHSSCLELALVRDDLDHRPRGVHLVDALAEANVQTLRHPHRDRLVSAAEHELVLAHVVVHGAELSGEPLEVLGVVAFHHRELPIQQSLSARFPSGASHLAASDFAQGHVGIGGGIERPRTKLNWLRWKTTPQ